jgi:fermentation-respiration switch protein FrsA (DUF1100 family)
MKRRPFRIAIILLLVPPLVAAVGGWMAGPTFLQALRREVPAHRQHLFALGESLGVGIALQSAAADPRIEAVVAEAAFASLREAAYDYAGLQKYPLLGQTFFAPGAWTMIYRGESLAGFPAAEVSPQKPVAARNFPVLLISDGADTTLPSRHARKIFAAASRPKELWEVPDAFHTAAMACQPAEFERRVRGFFAPCASAASAKQSVK